MFNLSPTYSVHKSSNHNLINQNPQNQSRHKLTGNIQKHQTQNVHWWRRANSFKDIYRERIAQCKCIESALHQKVSFIHCGSLCHAEFRKIVRQPAIWSGQLLNIIDCPLLVVNDCWSPFSYCLFAWLKASINHLVVDLYRALSSCRFTDACSRC